MAVPCFFDPKPSTYKGLTVRLAEPKDTDSLASLKLNVEKEIYGNYGTAEEQIRSHEEYNSPAYITRLLSIGSILAAFDGDNAVAMLSVRTEEVLFLSAFYSAQRGLGIGTFLLETTLAEYDQDKPVSIEVFERNEKTRNYFESLGFEEWGYRSSQSFSGERLVHLRSRVGRSRDLLKARK